MRVLLSSTAGDGHFGPLVPLARACLAAGHEVRAATPTSFAGAVRRSGLTHVPFPDAPPDVIGPVLASLPGLGFAEANETVMREVFGRLDAQYALPGILATLDHWRPDIILRDPAEFSSLAAAEAAGIPHVEVAIGVEAVMLWARDYLVEPLAELDALVGLPEGRLIAAMASAPVFTVVPASFDGSGTSALGRPALPRPIWRYRRATDAGPGRLPDAWGDPGHPLVYVTFGTVTAGLGHLAELFGSTLAALADLPIRVLLTTGHAGGLDVATPWPSNAHVEKYWPQDDVMPLAAAVVGHGGFGTTMSALSAGVPQVVVPLFTTDQELNAEMVASTGSGIHLSGGPAAVPELAGAVNRVLGDGAIRAHARKVAGEIAALPPHVEAVREIERIAATSSPPHPNLVLGT